MREFLRQLSVHTAIGAGAALLLALGEAVLGFPTSLRFYVGAALVAMGALLMPGASGSALFEKAKVRGIGEADIREHAHARRANFSAGARLFIVGAVMIASSFFF